MPAKPLVEAVDGASGELISMRVTRLQAAGLAVIGLGASIAPLDFAVNIAFPAITAAFALETRAIRWVAVCYVLIKQRTTRRSPYARCGTIVLLRRLAVS